MDISAGIGIQTGIGSRWEHQRRKDADQMSVDQCCDRKYWLHKGFSSLQTYLHINSSW